MCADLSDLYNFLPLLTQKSWPMLQWCERKSMKSVPLSVYLVFEI